MNASVFNEMTASTGNFNLHATWGDNQVYWDAPVTTNRLIYNAGNIIGQSNLWTAFSDISLAAAKQQLFKNGLSVATGNNNGSFTGNNNAFNLGRHCQRPYAGTDHLHYAADGQANATG